MFRPPAVCLFALLLAPAAAAQEVPGAANREALKKLDFLAGKWKGEAAVTAGPEKKTLTQTEDIQFRLGGAILVVEGVGRGKLPGKDAEGVLFNAFGVISYDAAAKQYKMKAYRAEGQAVDADFALTEKGFNWGFKEPPRGDAKRGVEVRYTMKLTDKGEWHEVGEYTLDGTVWTKFIEMTLTRVKE